MGLLDKAKKYVEKAAKQTLKQAKEITSTKKKSTSTKTTTKNTTKPVQPKQASIPTTSSTTGVGKLQSQSKNLTSQINLERNGVGAPDIFKLEKLQKQKSAVDSRITAIDAGKVSLLGDKNVALAQRMKNGTATELDYQTYNLARKSAYQRIMNAETDINQRISRTTDWFKNLSDGKTGYISPEDIKLHKDDVSAILAYYDSWEEFETLFGDGTGFVKPEGYDEELDFWLGGQDAIDGIDEIMGQFDNEGMYNFYMEASAYDSAQDYIDALKRNEATAYGNKQAFVVGDDGKLILNPDNQTDPLGIRTPTSTSNFSRLVTDWRKEDNDARYTQETENQKKQRELLISGLLGTSDVASISDEDWAKYVAPSTGLKNSSVFLAQNYLKDKNIKSYADLQREKQILEKEALRLGNVAEYNTAVIPEWKTVQKTIDGFDDIVFTDEGIAWITDAENKDAQKLKLIREKYSRYLGKEDYEKNSQVTNETIKSGLSVLGPDINAFYNTSKSPLSYRGSDSYRDSDTLDREAAISVMSDEEKRMFTYLYQTQGKEEAKAFLDELIPFLNLRFTAQTDAEESAFGKKHPYLAWARNVITSPFRKMESGANYISSFFEDDIDPYAPRFQNEYRFSAAEQGAKENFGNAGDWAYGATQTTAGLVMDMLVSKGFGTMIGSFVGNAASAASKVALASKAASNFMGALNGLSVANSTMLDYKRSGASDSEALGMGLLNGTIEAVVEKYSFEKLLKSPKLITGEGRNAIVQSMLKKGAYDFATEGGEEVLTSALTSVAAFITDNREHDAFWSAYDQYKADGLTDGDAFARAVWDVAPEYLEEFVVGGFAGAIFGTSNSVGFVRGVDKVRTDSGDFFFEAGTSREAVEMYLIKNGKSVGIESDADIAKYTNAIIDKSEGKKIDSKLEDEIGENAFLQGVLQGYVDNRIEEIERAKIEPKTTPTTRTDAEGARIATLLGNPTNKNAEAIIENDSLRARFESATGIKIEGTKSEQRALVKDNASKFLEVYKPTVKDSGTTKTNAVSDSNVGRIGNEVYVEFSEALTKDFVNQGLNEDVAKQRAKAVFDFMYNQGRNGMNKDVAINAASEMFGAKNKATYELFYTAGAYDNANALKGKEGAKLVVNDTLKRMRKTNKAFSYGTERAINAIAGRLGFDIEFVDEIEGGANASFDTATGVFKVSAKSKNPFLTAVIHESVHAGRSVDAKSYNKLANVVAEILGKDTNVLGKAFSNRLSLYKKEATGKDGKINTDLITEEMVAEVVSHVVSGDADFVNALASQDRGFVKRVFDAVKDFFEKVMKRYTGDAEAELSPEMKAAVDMLKKEQAKVIKAFEKVLDATEIKQGKEVKAAQMGEVLKSKPETQKLFSLSKSVEETQDLIAVHNLSAEQVVDVINRNQFIMPSVAVTNKAHTDFGEVSIVFRKETIDPNRNKANKLYGSDAWTPAQTRLKKNPTFDNVAVKDTLQNIKEKIGKGYSRIFDVRESEFTNTIAKSDGSIFDAYANNIGFQTAYAIENGLISQVPTDKDGRIDKALLQDRLEEKLDKDKEWRKYKKWLGGISDKVITSYDQSSNEDILNNMKAQPDSAKRFKLSDNGDLTVPATEYSSIEQFRQNKDRLSEDADVKTKAVGKRFVDWANDVQNKNDLPLRTVIKAINSSFDSRYNLNDIMQSFSNAGVDITFAQAKALQSLYKNAVELPTPYFEAKPQRAVGLDEVAMIVAPDNATELVDMLEESDIPYKLYGKGNVSERIDALNSIENVRFSKPEPDTESEVSKASISIPPVLNLDAEVQAKLNELVEKYGKINKSPDVNIPKAVSDEKAVRKHAATEIESEVVSREGANTLAEMILRGDKAVTYHPVSNEELLRRAQANIDAVGYENAIIRWFAWAESDKRIMPINIAEADLLIVEAQKRGDTDNYIKLITTLPIISTNHAQVLQAFSIIKKLPGVDANKVIDDMIGKMQLIKNRHEGGRGKPAKRIVVDEELREDYIKAKDKEIKESEERTRKAKDKVSEKLKKFVPDMSQEEIDNMIDEGWNEVVRFASIQGEPDLDFVLKQKQKKIHSHSEMDNLQSEFDKASSELEAEIEKLDDSNSEFKEMKKQIKSLKNRTETAKSRLEKIESEYGNLEDEMLEAEVAYNEAMNEYNDAVQRKKDVTKAKNLAKAAKEMADNAQKRAAIAEEKLNEYREAYEKARLEYLDWVNQIASLKSQTKMYKTYYKDKTSKLSSAQNRAKEWAEKLKLAIEAANNVKADFQTAWNNYLARKAKRESIEKHEPKGEKAANLEMVGLKRGIERMQEVVNEKFGFNKDGTPKVKIDIDVKVIEEYGGAILDETLGRTTKTESQVILEKISQQIADQVPATIWEKERAFRYFAMLSNPRTHIRNMASNAAMALVTMHKNLMAVMTEQTLGRAAKHFEQQKLKGLDSRSKNISWRFKSLRKKNNKLYQFAMKDVEELRSAIQGSGSLDGGSGVNVMSSHEILRKRKIFSQHWWSKLYNNKVSRAIADGMLESKREWVQRLGKRVENVINKGVLESASKLNSALLEAEDWIFSKRHYKNALTSYLAANNINVDTISEETLRKAREYAMSEAQRATFRENVKAAAALNQVSKISPLFGFFTDALVPFKKTPVNILRRGIEYSPYSLIKGLTKGLYDVKNGNISVAQWCDTLAQGFTGTQILLIGMLGFAKGFISGGNDDEETALRNKLFGEQTYSLKIGGFTYTIDWLSPASMPLFMGYNLAKAFDDDNLEISDAFDFMASLASAMPDMLGPLVDMSMLQGLTNAFQEAKYAEDDVGMILNFVKALPRQWFAQYIPSALKALTKTIDPIKRNTYYVDKTSKVPEEFQRYLNTFMAAVPGLSDNLEPSVNAKGEVMKNAEGNIFSRAIQNFISPGYYKKIRSTETDKEIERLYISVGEDAKGIIPKNMSKSIKVGDKKVELSAEQYTTYQKNVGKTYYKKLGEIIGTDFYKDLTDKQKVELVEKVYDYAIEKGREATLSEYRSDDSWLITAMEMDGGFQYIIDLEEGTKQFSEKDLADNVRDAFEVERNQIYNEIVNAYTPEGDFETRQAYYEDVYNYARKVALENNADGKYAVSEKWINEARAMTVEERAKFIYDKALNQGDPQEEDTAKEVKINADRETAMNEIFTQYKPSGKNPDFTEKYNDNVYKFADAMAKEKNDDDYLIANDAPKWIYQVQMLDPEYRDDYIRGKSIMATFDNVADGRSAMLRDDKISDEVKVMLATESTAEKYTIFLKPHNVGPATWLAVKAKYDSVKSIEVPGGADITKKQQVCDYINSLKISNEKKSALYRACGYKDYSESLDGDPLKEVGWSYVYDGTVVRGELNSRVGQTIADTSSYNNDAAPGQCVWYARGRAHEIAGANVPALGNANQIYANAKDSAKLDPTVANIRQDIFVCYQVGTSAAGQTAGHVIYIEGVDGNIVYYTENKSGNMPAGTLKWTTTSDLINGKSGTGATIGTNCIGFVDITKY